MRELNVKYIDQYKIVDCFIRDAYKSEEGVSEYIRIMDQNDAEGKELVVSWSSDYSTLKHLRWLRNKLAHEVGFDSDMCTKSDLAWLSAFDERLRTDEDPLSKLRKIKESRRQLAEQRQRELVEQCRRELEEQRRRDLAEQHQRELEEQRRRQLAEQRRRELTEQRQQQVRTSRMPETAAAAERSNKKTIWQRIKDFFFDES